MHLGLVEAAQVECAETVQSEVRISRLHIQTSNGEQSSAAVAPPAAVAFQISFLDCLEKPAYKLNCSW